MTVMMIPLFCEHCFTIERSDVMRDGAAGVDAGGLPACSDPFGMPVMFGVIMRIPQRLHACAWLLSSWCRPHCEQYIKIPLAIHRVWSVPIWSQAVRLTIRTRIPYVRIDDAGWGSYGV